MTPTVTLLLVDDDATVRELIETALTDAGFTVVAATDGTTALAELNADASRFRALITDIDFGSDPDGWEISRRARELAPEMPIVYVTGDSAHEWPSKGVPNSVIIPKPFAPAQLVTAVSGVITAADAHRLGLPPTNDADDPRGQ